MLVTEAETLLGTTTQTGPIDLLPTPSRLLCFIGQKNPRMIYQSCKALRDENYSVLF